MKYTESDTYQFFDWIKARVRFHNRCSVADSVKASIIVHINITKDADHVTRTDPPRLPAVY